jgi:hypothetical protein
MTDWADCTTVMIGQPSPKTFPSILNNMYVCAAVRCVDHMGEARTRVRAVFQGRAPRSPQPNHGKGASVSSSTQ